MSEADLYPLGLRLDGRLTVVVGGGGVAGRRTPALLAAGAQVLLVSPEVSPGLQGLAESGRIRWERRGFVGEDLDGAWLALAATDDHAVNEAVSAAAEQRRIFCVRADDRRAATAWTPAVTRRERLTVAVLAGGDPRRSAALRDAIGERLDDGSLDAPWGRTPEPGRPGLFGVTGTESSAEPPVERPAERAAEQLAERPAESAAEKAARVAPPVHPVALVGAGPGDPELITVRGRRLLSRADVVIADRLAPQLLLDELPAAVELIDAAKLPYSRAASQEEINRLLVDRALAGKRVVRLKGGDSFLFGRGGEELAACIEAGVPVEVVPGVTSALAAPAAAGIPVTQRGVTHDLTVVSGHLPPGHPGSLTDWSALGRLRGTLVLLMAVERLPEITAALLAAGRPATTPAAAIQEAATPRQRTVHATLATIADTVASEGVKPPAVIVIGEVAGLPAVWGLTGPAAR